jgi:predicted ATP-grasp superfamily ATP-dependent carboligase
MNLRHRRVRPPAAVVLGAGVNLIEVVRSLSLAGVPSAVVGPGGTAARLSRHATAVVTWNWSDPDLTEHEEWLVDRLLRYAETQPAPPPLLFTSDEALLFVCRHRDELAKGFGFAIADVDSVEAMVDKGRFAALVDRLGLVAPHTRVVTAQPDSAPADVSRLGFPLIVKPYRRDRLWHEVVEPAKATLVRDERELLSLWPRLATLATPVVLQESIAGPESRLESYHVYVDRQGRIAAEFAGRKIRTLPAAYGHTTSLTITDTEDVIERGRELVRLLDLRGVAKVDFKRAADGGLFLLEVNPRFHLWHHPGARAGVNIPALVYADLTDRPRPDGQRARAGVRWVHPLDLLAARETRVPRRRWARWAAGCEAKAFWAWDDPLPLIGAVAARIPSGRRYGPGHH